MYKSQEFIILLLMSYSPRPFVSKLIKKEKASRDAVSFYFEKPQGFDFYPGQYIKMTLDIENPDERGISRFFSITSTPSEKDLGITTRIIQSAFKMQLKKLSPGDEIQFNGPFGSFVLTDEKKPLIFLAGGIGITPFRSMIKFVCDNKLSYKIKLFVSWKTYEDMVYHEELRKISEENKNILYVPAVTHLLENSSWIGERGRIDKEKIEKYAGRPEDHIFYISGPGAMVEAMVKMVLEMGIASDQIKTDKFPGY